jgi:hypothetical protein
VEERIRGKEKSENYYLRPVTQQEQPFAQVNLNRSIWIK